jgi:hypothetical protein
MNSYPTQRHPHTSNVHIAHGSNGKNCNLNCHHGRVVAHITIGSTSTSWQFKFWLPSTEEQAADFETKMSKDSPEGWAEHRKREKRNIRNIP